MFTSTQILIPQLRMMSDNGMLGFLPQEVDMGNIPDAVTKLWFCSGYGIYHLPNVS